MSTSRIQTALARVASKALVVAGVTFASLVWAGPLDDPHVGDIGFSGPTSGDLTAVYWNPAGLGLLEGPQAIASGAFAATTASIDRTSIDPATGANPGTRTFPTATGKSRLQPFRWPLGPNGFWGIGAGIGKRFGIGLALYSPFSSHLTMSPAADGQEPARYHLVSIDSNHVATTLGIAIHASESLQVGAAPGLLFPTMHLTFDQDTGAGNEDPAAAARYDFATRGIVLPPAFFLSFGALYRRGRLSLGFSYTTGPLGADGAITLPLDRVQITLPAAVSGGPVPCPPSTPSCLMGRMLYRLPSMYAAGATFQLKERWSLTGMVRWVRNSVQDKITILVAGPSTNSLLGTQVPDHIVLYRGLDDTWDVRGRVVYARDRYRLGATLRFETSAVPASRVNASAIDGMKIEPAFAAELRIWRQIRLGAGYAFTYMFPVDTGASVFDPLATSACKAAGGALDTPACQARLAGQARPSAAGSYHLWRQTLSLLVSISF